MKFLTTLMLMTALVIFLAFTNEVNAIFDTHGCPSQPNTCNKYCFALGFGHGACLGAKSESCHCGDMG